MNHIKLFEEWSPKFNRTLQGASAIATSTNKGFGKAAKAVKDYAEKQISKEEFSLELENGDKLIITHDANFLLNPISEFTKVNPGKLMNAISGDKGTYFNIPVKVKTSLYGGIELPIILFRSPDSLTFASGAKTNEGGVGNSTVVLGPFSSHLLWQNRHIKHSQDRDKGFATRFSDKSGLENFIAMAIQSILSSPERGTPIETESLDITPSHLGMDSFPEQMTKEKFFLISLFKNNILNKDMREFTM